MVVKSSDCWKSYTFVVDLPIEVSTSKLKLAFCRWGHGEFIGGGGWSYVRKEVTSWMLVVANYFVVRIGRKAKCMPTERLIM